MRRLAALLVLLIATLPALAQDRRTDEHSYAQPDKVRITDLGLDLQVDFARHQLAGTATLDAAGHGTHPLEEGDAYVVPPGLEIVIGRASSDLELLEVALPAIANA